MLEVTKEFDVVDELKNIDEFAIDLVKGMLENRDDIDCVIESKARGWKINRISKVALTVIRLSVYQIIYSKDLTIANDPVGVIINEAVRITKKYSTVEDGAFVNGVLGTIARVEKQDEIDRIDLQVQETIKPEDCPLD